ENDARGYYYRGADELVVNCSGTPPHNNNPGETIERCGEDSVLVHMVYNISGAANLGGRVFQWQSKPLGSIQPFTDIPGAESNFYSTLIHSAIIFRMKDSCVDGSAPYYTEPDTFIYMAYPKVDSISATRQGLAYTF